MIGLIMRNLFIGLIYRSDFSVVIYIELGDDRKYLSNFKE